MAPSTVNIDLNKLYTIVVTGGELAAIVQGLGELPHKIAGPLEAKIVAQITAAGTEHDDGPIQS